MMNMNIHHQLIKCLMGPIRLVRGLLVNNIIPTIQKIVDDNVVNAKSKTDKLKTEKKNKSLVIDVIKFRWSNVYFYTHFVL